MKDISRRDFLKMTGAGAAAIGVSACENATKGALPPTVIDRSPGEMVKRSCGEDQVSLLGYGCMRWPMIKDENGKDIIDQNAVNELVDYAMAHGVNYYDTSPVYLQGQSEEATAKALLRYPRDSYFLATKLSNFSNYTYENSVKMYKRSLEIFQTDHIDYYLLHSISGGDAFRQRYEDTGIMDFLLEEKKKGHIRKLGLSFHGHKEGFDELMELHEKYHWDFVQIQMNFVDWNHAAGRNTNASYLYEELDKREIPIVIMEPLLGGRLANLPGPVAERLKGKEPSKSIASWSFRFSGTHPRVLSILSGMTYMENLEDNVDTFTHFKPLDEEDFKFLDEMALMIRDYPLINCNMCQYCMPCPYGIDIPSIFKYYNDSINSGTFVQNAEQENYQKLRKKYLTGYNKAVETIRQADHCIACNQCSPHCPQSLRIPRELQRVDEYIEKLKQNKL